MSKRLEDIKNEVAKEQGYESFYNLITDYSFCGSSMENVINEISTLYATECVNASLYRASEKVVMNYHDGHHKTNTPMTYVQFGADNIKVQKESITNPDNIALL